MKDVDKLDIITYAVLFATVVCLIAMVVMQNNINKQILLLANETADENEEVFTQEIQDALFQTTQANVEETTELTFVTETTLALITEEVTSTQPYFNETYENTTSLYTTVVSSTTVHTPVIWWTHNANTQTEQSIDKKEPQLDTVFVYSKNSNKLHSRNCPYALKIKDENKRSIEASQAQELLDKGYTFCSYCQGYVIEE